MMRRNQLFGMLFPITIFYIIGSLSCFADIRTIPSSVTVTIYQVQLSTNGLIWYTVFEDPAGISCDLINEEPVYGTATLPAGEYHYMKVQIGNLITWTGENPYTGGEITHVTDLSTEPDFGGYAYFNTYSVTPIGQPTNNGLTPSTPLLLCNPIQVLAGTTTELNLIFGFTIRWIDADEYYLEAPSIFVAASNASVEEIEGSYYVVCFEKINTTPDNITNGVGWGTITFNGDGTCSGSLTFNEQAIGAAAVKTPTKAYTGLYGINADGSMWLTVEGEAVLLRCGLSADKNAFVGTFLLGTTSNMIVYGVKIPQPTVSSYTFTGNFKGAGYSTKGDLTATPLEWYYVLAISDFSVEPATDTTLNVSSETSTNSLFIQDPLGTPTYTTTVHTATSTEEITCDINPEGIYSFTMEDPTDTITGEVYFLADASLGIMVQDIDDNPSKQEYGVFIKKPTGKTLLDLHGRYFGAFFENHYQAGGDRCHYCSGSFIVEFDGAGGAEFQMIINEDGTITYKSGECTYSVSSDGEVTLSPTDPSEEIGVVGQLSINNQYLQFNSILGTTADPHCSRIVGLAVKLE